MGERARRVLGGGAVIGLLLLWTVRTGQQVQVWSTNLALWSQAVRVNPRLPQARVNLAAAYLDQHWWMDSAAEDTRAILLAQGTSDERIVHKVTAEHFRWISLFVPLCDRPAWAHRCSSF